GAPLGAGADHSAVEWRSRARPDGAGLAARGLRRSQTGLVVPGQPRRRVRTDLAAVLLPRPPGVHGVAPGVQTRGNETGEHAGNVGTMRIFVKQGVFALPNKQLQGALGPIIVERRPGHGYKAR